MFTEEFRKSRDGDVENVLAVIEAGLVDCGGGGEAFGGLEGREGRGRVAGVDDTGEDVGGGIEDVLVALVREEDQVGLSGAL